MADPTVPWGIPLFDDNTPFAPIQAPFNAQSEALNDALSDGAFAPYTTKALLDAAPGTRVGQHASVYADATVAYNGDYRWDGTGWLSTSVRSPARDTFQLINASSIGGGVNIGTLVTIPTRSYAQRVMVAIDGFVSPSSAGDAGVFVVVTNGTAVANPQVRIYTQIGGQFYGYSRHFYVNVAAGIGCTLRARSEGSVVSSYQVSLETHALVAGEY